MKLVSPTPAFVAADLWNPPVACPLTLRKASQTIHHETCSQTLGALYRLSHKAVTLVSWLSCRNGLPRTRLASWPGPLYAHASRPVPMPLFMLAMSYLRLLQRAPPPRPIEPLDTLHTCVIAYSRPAPIVSSWKSDTDLRNLWTLDKLSCLEFEGSAHADWPYSQGPGAEMTQETCCISCGGVHAQRAQSC